jgi:hypothetical protein
MKGYKVFSPDFTCRGFQYEVGKTFEDDVSPWCCHIGFHFCKQVKDCFNYYNFNPNNKVAEVEAFGEISESVDKCCTNKIHIIRELTWHEVLELVNSGKACTGINNIGDCNSGNRNSGSYNVGNNNHGIYNTGNQNNGDSNVGNRNLGNGNVGNYNKGFSNTGTRNVGNRNSGNYNIGDYNGGDYNAGNCNIGDYNAGNCNTGDFNRASNVLGCFNTEPQKLKFFDKETDMTLDEWRNSAAYCIMSKIDSKPVGWIESEHMSDEEKAEHPEHKTTGGYLWIHNNTDCYSKWWKGLYEREREIIKSIPNFDAEKFKKITGIDVG